MNIYVLFSLLFFLAPGGCPIYSIDLSTLEVPNDFQNELTLQSMLSSELHQYRSRLNSHDLTPAQHFEQAHQEDSLERSELMRSIEDRIKATYYAASMPEELEHNLEKETEPQSSKVYRSASDESTFLGTNLFGNYPKKCFSAEDIALMSARKDFEMLIPKSYPQCLLHDGIVYTLMKYFNSVNQVIKRMSDLESRRLLQRAFYDALGGYLRYYLVPVAQVSYYAGRLKLCTVERLVSLYRQCQLMLNTNGNGWRTPVADVLSQLKDVNIIPIKMNEEKGCENDASSCALLDQTCVNEDAQREQMIVPLPHLESEDSSGFLNNIFLPFKRRRIYNLRSPDAAFILVKFYKTLRNCYRFQGLSPKTYNRKLRNWIRESLQVHYRDEAFYPGLGGVLQIYEALGCSTKSPEQTEHNEEPLLDEADCQDYPSSLEVTEKPTKKKSKKEDRDEETSRKQSRSPRQRHLPCDGTENKDGDETKNPNESNEEECIDCDDSRYIIYIVAFLVLLLLILLLIICCCLHRRRKPKDRDASKPPQQPKSNQKTSEKPSQKPADVEAAKPPPNELDNESCWSSLFRSRKKKPKHVLPHQMMPTPGMGLIGSQLEDSYPYTMKMVKLQKYLSHKKGSNTEHNYELASLTSTSSLGYQFNRKFIPLKPSREKREEYYTKAERKRSKAASKQSSYVLKREKEEKREREKEEKREREREKKSSKAASKSVEKLPEKRESPLKEEDEVRELFTQNKYKRQEGGLTKITNEREFKPSESESSRKTYSCPPRKNQTLQDKTQYQPIPESPATRWITSETSTTNPLPAIVESQTDNNQEVASMPLSTPDHSIAVQSLNCAASWETLEDDDSK